MAEVPLPTPTQVPVPSTDIRNAVFASAKLDEEVTGTGEFYTDRLGVKRLTNTGRNNQFDAAQLDRANRFEQFLLSSGYVFLGDYEDGPFQFSARNQYIRYNNQYYRLNAATDVGFTTTGTDATSFANDVTHFVLMDGDTLRQNLGSGEEGVGDALLAVKQPYTGAVARTQHDKNWDSINLLDFVYATDVVDGFVDYGLGLNRAIAAMSFLGSTSVEHIPRRRINVPAGLLHIKTKVELSFGPFALCGEGIFQTVFAIHPGAESDDDYLFDFSSVGWDATGRVRISELYLSNFSVLGETANWIRKRIFNFYGVGWDFAVENVQVWSPPLSSFDMTDVMDGVFNQVRINSGGRLLSAGSEVTHQINMLNQYDNCNAIRFMGCHFENNYSGVSYIRGGSNNILFGGMCKFENNSRNNLVPVNQIYGSTSDSVKFENIFVSHPAHITVYWLDSNGRHVSIRGGSFMSPSDLGGYTGLRWFRIHRTNWASATACVQLVADIDMMHVDGYGYNGANQLSPFDFEGEVVFRAKAIRLARPNAFMYINWNCKIDIENLTLLGAVTSDYQTSLFNVAASSVKADVNVDKYNGSVAGTVYTNTAMTTASRRQSIINVRGKSLQSSSLTLSEGTDPLGYDESWTWNASGNVANIGYCHTGKRMVVRCADTSNCLIAGGNIFLPGGAVTAACTITLMAMNTSFRQGWVEVSRVAGV
ncbi:TPA: hypothetical protein PCI40_002298 [Klebsiella pneumoniae]|nr:hypothetical protein [Klebsiella pneumoniae]HDE1410276.1 hypothetical protein [Klebsiella pneumoniae]HDG7429064.1 hypothetical protein [Klebsiella pneumoniae]HDG7495484.1 hypothetical protein [Klebsiella pneumoniae]